MATAHINGDRNDFAPDVIMPGDPRRATRIANTVLTDSHLVTDVRGILGYTGTYKGRPLSVMASGMGMPSITIYATELVREFGVKRIVRVGTSGGLTETVRLRDVVIALSAHTDSAMTAARIPGVHFSHTASFDLARKACAYAQDQAGVDHRVHVGSVFTTDHFYFSNPESKASLQAVGTLAVEMEAAGLYAVAATEGCEALTVVTVTDHLLTTEQLTSDEREQSFLIALDIALAALDG